MVAAEDRLRTDSPDARYRDDPVSFLRDRLGDDPWSRQEQIARALALHKRVTVRSCNGSGKTWLAARLALWFLYSRPGSIVVTTAVVWRQVRDQLWRQIRTCHQKCKLPGTCLQTELNIRHDWYATGISTDNPVAFQGTHSGAGVLLIVDEAAGVPEAIYEAGAGFMTGEESYTLLIGNPNTPSGTFYDSHQRWPAEQRFHISALDVPSHILAPSYIERARQDWGEESPAYQVRVLGEFPSEGDDTLIGMRYVAAAQARDGEEVEGPLPATIDSPGDRKAVAAEVIAGMDVARFGGDESVIYARQGDRVIAADYWHGQDTQVSAGRALAFCRAHGVARVLVDEIGVGAGVVDALQHMVYTGLRVEGVNVGTPPRDTERFANKRAEYFWALRERFREGRVSIPTGDDLLYSQLCALKYAYTPTGKIQIESKDAMKARGLPSPDRADALCLAFGVIPSPGWARDPAALQALLKQLNGAEQPAAKVAV